MNIAKKFNLSTLLSGRAVIARAFALMQELDTFAEHFTVGRKGPGLLDALLQGLLVAGADGDSMLSQLEATTAGTLTPGYTMTQEEGNSLILLIILTSLHFAVHAVQAETDDEAYAFLMDARYLRGLADGVIYSGNDGLVRADFSRLGGKGRHAETNEMKGNIQIWFAENRHLYRSTDAAARAACTVEPIAFVTARKWISEFKKADLQ